MSSLKKTALHAFHLAKKAKMADFSGYDMPISYPKLGILKEHMCSRTAAGVVDISHVGLYQIRGADREKFMEYITPVDLQKTKPGQATLTMLTNPQGGIKDDCIVTKMDDHLFLVLNGGCKDKDVAHIQEQMKNAEALRGADVQFITVEGHSVVALQGPTAAPILSKLMDGVPDMDFMTCRPVVNIKGMPTQVARCGYSGEDGFELAVEDKNIVPLVELLLANGAEMVGLGARDSLRLEAGLNLYDHELSEDVNPVMACFMWSISKRRMQEGGFVGYEAIKYFKENASKGAVPRLRVGVVSTGPVARQHTVIEVDGKEVGRVTSGCPSPCLKKNIALAYVDRDLAKPGVKVDLVVRDRRVPAEISTPRFVPTHYYRKP